ncbi:centromere protein P isoform X2 [Heterodontus francisci]|uniref:centromere protein P isoform X2 n=1 Tax=Heterodontus francisci TaxID=7792 RepID=UPI00355B2675
MDKLLHHTYEDEIHSLQEEIRMLEQQAKDSHFYSGEFLKTMDMQREKFSVQNSESWKCSSTDLEAQLEQAESQIALLTQLTGIGFNKCTMTTVGDGNQTKQYRLSGYSRSLQFELEFELIEIQTKENVTATVTELNIILESSECCDLSQFISRAEEKKNLLLFFRTLSVFTKWYEHRQVTFRHFKAFLSLRGCEEERKTQRNQQELDSLRRMQETTTALKTLIQRKVAML